MARTIRRRTRARSLLTESSSRGAKGHRNTPVLRSRACSPVAMTVAVQARRKLPEARATGIGRRLGTSRRLWEAQIADPFDLQRFVDAQAPVYERVRQELKVGRKQSHWMWFIFPQIAGLGQSPMSVRFAIASLDEAKAYLAHPILGARLRECAQLTLDVEGKRARRLRFDRRDEIPLFHDPVRAGHAGRRRLSALHRQVFCRRLGSGHACEALRSHIRAIESARHYVAKIRCLCY